MDMYYLLCSEAHKKYDYFMFMDLDAIFHSPELSIGDVIDQFPDQEIIIGQDKRKRFDHIGSIVNTGSFIVKNTDWTKSFFKLIWERYMSSDGTVGSVGARWSKGDDDQWQCKDCKWAGMYYEQGTFGILMKYDLVDSMHKVAVTRVEDMCNMNPKRQSFVLHLYSTPNKKREKIFRDILNTSVL
jgi:hypothetical protein